MFGNSKIYVAPQCNIFILIWNGCTWRSWWLTSQFTWAGTSLDWAASPAWPSGWAALHSPLATGQMQTAHFNWGACRQLPLSTSHYASCAALPLSNCAARSFYVNTHSVWQYKCWIYLFSLRKLYVTAKMTKMKDNGGLCDAACIRGAQDLKDT